MTRVTSDPV